MLEEAAQFRSFIDRANALMGGSVLAQHQKLFVQFIEASRPLAIEEARRLQAQLARHLKPLRPWLLNPACDLLAVAGLSFDEDAYTELIAWALSERAHPPTVLARQRAWLADLGISDELLPKSPASVRTQILTDDGIPDLIMDCGKLIVVVEAKTGSFEHVTPGGEHQTNSYESAVRRLLGRPDAIVRTVFLTADGTPAANPAAINTTYARVAFALAAPMDPEHLPPGVRFAFGLLLTHLLTHGTPLRTRAGDSLLAFLNWDDGAELDAATAIRRLPILRALSPTIILKEER